MSRSSSTTTPIKLHSLQGSLLVFTLACLAGMTALSIDITIPSMPNIARTLGTTTASIQTTLSLFVFCYGIGQLSLGLSLTGLGVGGR